MALTKASVLHYWSARFGAIPIIGGNPVHTRSSIAKWVDQMGMVRTSPVNTPRSEWATIDGERRPVVRLERARTNQMVRSEEFDNASWTKIRTSISANATIAPDGTLTADKAVEDGSNNTHLAANQAGSPTASTVQTISVFAKPAGRNFILLELAGKDGVARYAYFNVSAGTIHTVSGLTDSGIEAVGGGWYRCWIAATSGAGGSTAQMSIYLASADNTASYAGDSVSGVYLWGAQWETDGARVSSYIPTIGTNVTRTTDIFYWDFVAPPQAMMAYFRIVRRHLGGRIFEITNAVEGDPRFIVYFSPINVIHATGASSVAVGAAGDGAIGDTIEGVALLKSDGKIRYIQSVNGAAVTDTGESGALALASAWAGPRLYLNSDGGNAGDVGISDFAELKLVKYADVVGATAQAIMDELRAFELAPSGEVVA